MKTMTNEIQIVDVEHGRGSYDMQLKRAIIDHPEHGRLYLTQAFGGMDTLAGGAIRWRHGIACRLRPGDTLNSLRGEAWNDIVSRMEAMEHGYDDERPVLDWSGSAIESVARKAGL